MNSSYEKWSLVIGISFIVLLLLACGIFIVVYPLILKKLNLKQKKKDRQSSRYIDEDSVSILKESETSENEEMTVQMRRSKNLDKVTEITCAIEYRTRVSQLTVLISRVYPSVLSHYYINNLNKTSLSFIVFLNGDSTNSPCESVKKPMGSIIDLNQMFVFTVMPYDLPSLELVVQAILICDGQKYVIGTLHLRLIELDQQSYIIQKSYNLAFPREKMLLSNCMLCLSITNCKNLIKIKVIRLNILDSLYPEDTITGLSLRLMMEGPEKPPQTFDSSKKKYKTSLLFNETMIFETLDGDMKDSRLKVELLESCLVNGEEFTEVCGCIEMSSDVFMTDNFNEVWTETVNNPDSEVIKWYPLSYQKYK